ncbi:hypothetical protein JZ785_01190 [Alicyclobacillus curvatus]|jgi:hypothetical protein|nr:hypothetical protein JZ785_01190 [Alicyclobacillus curvatus]
MAFIATLLWGPAPTEAQAASLKMSASVGLNGFYDRYGWVPVELRFADVPVSTSAVVSVQVNASFDASRNAGGALEWSVPLVRGRVATREISVPGWVVYSNAVVDCLVNNEVVAQTRLSGNELGKVAFVGVLSTRAEAAQFLTGSTDGAGGLPVLPMTFAANSLPTNANLLQSLTAVVASPDELGDMNSAHREALLEWVRLGGLLVVTGTSPTPPAFEAGILPLVAGPSHDVAGSLFARFAGTGSSPPKPVSVSVSSARQEAAIWAGNQTTPLIAALSLGRGTVVQTAFTPTESSLISWSNNASLWTQILGRATAEPQSALPPKLTAQPVDSLASASAVLAPLRVPSLPFWAIIFVIYAALVGPILFIVLRKFRVEPWAWIVLPLISLVTTLGMYSFGVRERPQGLLTEGVGVFDLVGDGTAEGYGVRSFMSPSISPVDVSSSGQMMVLPLSQSDIHAVDSATVYHGTFTVVHYPQVGRWTVHDVVSSGAALNQGQVDLQLWSTANQLSGIVRNDTPYALHDVALCWNGKLVLVGDMTPGTVITIGKTTAVESAGGSYLTAYSSYNHDLTRGIGRSISNFAAQTNLMRGSTDTTDVMMVATTTDRTPGLPSVVSELRTSSDHSLVLVREFGNVTIYPSIGVTIQ